MQIPPTWELPAAIRERLGETGGKQRAMIEDGHLLLILHKLPQPEDKSRQSVYFWRGAEGEWKNPGGAGLGALKSHLEEYARAIDELDVQLDNANNAAELFRVLEKTVPLHRAAKNQHLALQTAREGLPDAHEIISLRDIASDIDRNSEILDIAAHNALDFHIARQTEEQNRLTLEMTYAGHKLNTMAAIFLPVTAMASILGMNSRTGFENAPPLVSWTLVLCALLVGLILRAWLNLKKR